MVNQDGVTGDVDARAGSLPGGGGAGDERRSATSPATSLGSRDELLPQYGCEDFFGERFARRSADRYRTKGLGKTARSLFDFLGSRGLAGRRVPRSAEASARS